MSRFIKKLDLVAQEPAPPMGFRKAQADAVPKLLLVAGLAEPLDDSLAEQVKVADAVLFNIAKGAKSLQKAAQQFGDMPWGAMVPSIGDKESEGLLKAGCDFAVFPMSSAVPAPASDSKLGLVLQTEVNLDEGMIRAMNKLPADAFHISAISEGERLTWHELLLLQRFTGLLAKPLLASVSSDSTSEYLRTIWETGVDGIVVNVTDQTAGKLADLRKAIDGLKSLPPRKKVRAEALVPFITESTTSRVEVEEEEEEEE